MGDYQETEQARQIVSQAVLIEKIVATVLDKTGIDDSCPMEYKERAIEAVREILAPHLISEGQRKTAEELAQDILSALEKNSLITDNDGWRWDADGSIEIVTPLLAPHIKTDVVGGQTLSGIASNIATSIELERSELPESHQDCILVLYELILPFLENLPIKTPQTLKEIDTERAVIGGWSPTPYLQELALEIMCMCFVKDADYLRQYHWHTLKQIAMILGDLHIKTPQEEKKLKMWGEIIAFLQTLEPSDYVDDFITRLDEADRGTDTEGKDE